MVDGITSSNEKHLTVDGFYFKAVNFVGLVKSQKLPVKKSREKFSGCRGFCAGGFGGISS